MSTIPFSMCDPEGEMLCAPSCATSTRLGAITINAVDDDDDESARCAAEPLALTLRAHDRKDDEMLWR